jgi:hypothetical protein
MGAGDLLTVLHRKPFEPFRIVTSDGVNYEIHHPKLVIVSLTGAVIGYPDPSIPGAAQRLDIVGLEHIVRLEEVPRAAAPGPAGGADGSGS